MIKKFRCELCRRKTRIEFFGPVPKRHSDICPGCWGSRDIRPSGLRRAIRDKVSRAHAAIARGERAYARALAMEARAMKRRLDALLSYAKRR